MAAEELTENEKTALTNLIDGKNYEAQACFFMNAFWPEIKAKETETGEDICEEIYSWLQIFQKIDKDGKDGKKLDAHGAARVWEAIGETMTHLALRAKLAEVDLDADGKMSVIEFLLCKNDAKHFDASCFNFEEMMKRPQGTNEELAKAMRLVDELIEQGAVWDQMDIDIQAEIDKFEGKVVKQNRAKNKLATHRQRDMTPYNKKLLDAQAAVRKARKAEATSAAGTDWMVEKKIKEAKSYKPKGDLTARN